MGADYLLQLCGSLAGGLKYTVSLFFITVLFSIPIGLLLSFTRVGRSRVLKGIVGAFVWIMRGTPLLLQLYFFCYGITFLPGIGEYLVYLKLCCLFLRNFQRRHFVCGQRAV